MIRRAAVLVAGSNQYIYTRSSSPLFHPLLSQFLLTSIPCIRFHIMPPFVWLYCSHFCSTYLTLSSFIIVCLVIPPGATCIRYILRAWFHANRTSYYFVIPQALDSPGLGINRVCSVMTLSEYLLDSNFLFETCLCQERFHKTRCLSRRYTATRRPPAKANSGCGTTGPLQSSTSALS